MEKLQLLSISLIMMLGISSAQAIVIYDNGVPNLAAGTGIDSEFIFNSEAADNFSLSAGASTITDIQWWGSYSDSTPDTDDFTVRIYNDNGGVPEQSPTIFDLNVGDPIRTVFDTTGQPVYEYSLGIAPLTLDADTQYWLSIVNNVKRDSNLGVEPGWVWYGSDIVGNIAARQGSNLWNTPSQLTLAFNLSGSEPTTSVPEPSVLGLMSLGLVGIGFSRRRKAHTRSLSDVG